MQENIWYYYLNNFIGHQIKKENESPRIKNVIKFCKSSLSPYNHPSSGLPFEKRLENQLQEYFTFLSEIPENDYEGIKTKKENILSDIKKLNRKILNIIDNYYKGQVKTSIRNITDIIELTQLPTTIIKTNNTWFRMRRNDTEFLYPKEMMFHIPLNSRHKVDNQRYSLSGFPCLYLGKSLYLCWEELDRPPIATTNMVGISNRKTLECIDLRIPKEIQNEYHLKIIPLIVACSISVANKGGRFKPEYIISQLILQNLIDKNRKIKDKKYRVHGILYTSTRVGEHYKLYSDEELYENLIIPTLAYSTSKTHFLCKDLCQEFSVSDPISLNIETLKNQDKLSDAETQDEYRLSQLGRLQEKLKKATKYELDSGKIEGLMEHYKYYFLNIDENIKKESKPILDDYLQLYTLLKNTK